MYDFVHFLPSRTGLFSIELFSVYHVHIQCLILINEWTNLEFCSSFAIRQQWLPPGVTNCMVFNFNCCHKRVVMNYLTHWPAFCYEIMSGILKIVDLNVVWDSNLEAISAFFCGSGHVIPKHVLVHYSQMLNKVSNIWSYRLHVLSEMLIEKVCLKNTENAILFSTITQKSRSLYSEMSHLSP